MEVINKNRSGHRKKFKHTSSFYRRVETRMRYLSARKYNKQKVSERISTVSTNSSKTFHNDYQENVDAKGNRNSPYSFDETFNEFHESENDSDSEYENEIVLANDIKNTVLKYKIPHAAVNELLIALKKYGVKSFPKDSRSFLKTSRHIQVIPMGDGEYWHNGLKIVLEDFLNTVTVNEPMTLLLKFNIDGLPLYSSSKKQFWPILVSIHDFPTLQPGIIGIYSGSSKPSNLNEYLKHFVDELKCLLDTGLFVNNFQITIGVHSFICDTPARSFIKGKFSSYLIVI